MRNTKDREFARAVGIREETEICDMCHLLSLSVERCDNEKAVNDELIREQAGIISGLRQKNRQWQLATFAATLLAILFAVASLKR